MWKKTGKVVSIIGATAMLLLLQVNSTYASAATDETVYTITGTSKTLTLAELKSRFRSTSIEIIGNANTYALEAAKYDLALESLNVLDSSNSLYPDAKLQVDLYQYAKDYQGSLTESSNKKLEAGFIKECYQIIVNQEQRDYYNAYGDYLNTSYYITNKKYQKGYVSADTVDQIKTDIDTNTTSLLENQYDRENLILDTGLDTNAIQLPISLTGKTFYESGILSLIRTEDLQSEQLMGTITAYQNYLANSNLAVGTAAYRKIQLQISDYQLQLQKHEMDMELFAKKAVKSYNLVCKQCQDAKNKTDVAAKQYSNAQMQYNKGKIAKIDLAKILITKEEKELNYYTLCYQKMVWEYVLENGIYGVTP